MTPDQITLVQDSWKQVAPIQEQAADLFYDRLFEVAPGVRSLFPEDMKAQKRALMAMIGLAVAGLRDPDALAPKVRDAGARHVAYGALPDHYPVVGETLLWTLEKGLGNGWSEELAKAWGSTYDLLAALMIEGAAQAAE